MANEIKIAWITGKTLTANVFQPDGSVRETGISLTENATGGLYLGNCATIQSNDLVLAYEGNNFLGSVEYLVIAGAGATTKVYTVVDGDSNPIDGVEVWVTTDIAGSNIIASGVTNALGKVTFYLDSGTYYIWSRKSGYNFTNPDTEVV